MLPQVTAARSSIPGLKRHTLFTPLPSLFSCCIILFIYAPYFYMANSRCKYYITFTRFSCSSLMVVPKLDEKTRVPLKNRIVGI